jgi:preprotein translocase subunit SecB
MTMTDSATGVATAAGPQLSLARVYLKDASLEAPSTPAAFLSGFDPNLKVDLEYKVDTQHLEKDAYEVVITLSTAAKDPTKTIFLVELQQGGVFIVQGAPEDIDVITNVQCPQILFPYAREAVDNLIVKAGFPPLMIGQVDFQLLFDKKRGGGEAKQ